MPEALARLNRALPDAIWFTPRLDSQEAALIVEPEADPIEAARLITPVLDLRPEFGVLVPQLFEAASLATQGRLHPGSTADPGSSSQGSDPEV